MAGVTGIYYGLDEATLLQMRSDVLAQLDAARKGKRFQSVSGGGKAFSKDNMTMAELRDDLAEISAALQRLNPQVYGRRSKMIVADFSRSRIT
ncbi:hypothetical protein OpiT1DRAFT_01293 [Opitutaceae bacterium TAV1]|nr:hypothetical protein OpiT1DRAFT_01293 [Opitutaceae bacterium TAV1]